MKLTQVLSILIILFLFSCKNEPSATTTATAPEKDANSTSATTSSKDISTLDALDHDFNVTPEGSRFFFKGFFNKALVDAAMTFNKGSLHVKNGLITSGVFNLDTKTIEMISNRNAPVEAYMKSPEAFDVVKYPAGTITIEECSKAISDQEATHIIKGKIELRGKTIPLNVRVRIDYKPKYITILSDQIIIKGTDLGVTMANAQDNLYFTITLNAELF